ncbi:MAG: hypothetical protein JWO12_561, partial [Frankiales bacterium]|nr:hypothetical protein [Frankiales bacterium]
MENRAASQPRFGDALAMEIPEVAAGQRRLFTRRDVPNESAFAWA